MENRFKRIYIIRERHLLFSPKNAEEGKPFRAPGRASELLRADVKKRGETFEARTL